MPRPLSTGPASGSSSSSTDILHTFPAMYIGSTSTSSLKSQSTDTLVDRVLQESKPSRARPITISLSLLEIRYLLQDGGGGGVAVGGASGDLPPSRRGGEEGVVFLTHDTSRIRSMGAYSEDKRFAGYVIKEEGKPLTGHVIQCNSAALMVSIMSFLRQSCQLTSHQRGGSFYDELSTDESGDWGETTVEVCMYVCMSVRSDTDL